MKKLTFFALWWIKHIICARYVAGATNLSPCFTECETCWLKTIRSVSCKCCKCWTSSEIYLSELFLLPSGDKIKETWFVVRIDKVKGKGTHYRDFKHNQVRWKSTWVISYHRIKLQLAECKLKKITSNAYFAKIFGIGLWRGLWVSAQHIVELVRNLKSQ